MFTQKSFGPISSHGNSDMPNIWTYRTTDSSTDVLQADYFINKINEINNGDFINLASSDGNFAGRFLNSGGVITVFLDVVSFSPTEDINVERLVNGASVAVSQLPTGTGEANEIQMEFGPAENGALDPVQLLSDGSLVINKAGTYRIKISVIFGRTGTGGTAKLRFGAFINGVQAGLSIGGDVPNQNSENPYADEAWLTLPAGITVTYKLLRDSSGADDGGVFQPVITPGTAPSWNPAACAAIRVERWV